MARAAHALSHGLSILLVRVIFDRDVAGTKKDMRREIEGFSDLNSVPRRQGESHLRLLCARLSHISYITSSVTRHGPKKACTRQCLSCRKVRRRRDANLRTTACALFELSYGGCHRLFRIYREQQHNCNYDEQISSEEPAAYRWGKTISHVP